MNRYRITPGTGYNGCIPIQVFWVEVRENTFWGNKWRRIKGFEDKKKAIELLNILTNK